MKNILKNSPVFSFLLDGKPFSELSVTPSVTEEGNVTKSVYLLGGGLKLTNILTVYPEYDACEWVNFLEHSGDESSALISELWDSNVTLPLPPTAPKLTGPAYLPQSENVVKVYAPKGSEWSDKEFFCDVDELKHNHYDYWLSVGSKRRYASTGGRSSDSDFAPFFNVKHGGIDTGYIIAVGWTGQWNAEIERGEAEIRFKSRIEGASFRLFKGESFRTSSVTIMKYDGNVSESQNKWRRFVKEVYSPIGKRQVPKIAPFCAGLWGGMSTDGCLERIAAVQKENLPFDHYWMDAGWYGAGNAVSPDEYEGDWAIHTGNWEVNAFRHPDGLLDVAKAIKDSEKRFILWFEPERVRSNAPICAEHPEYLLNSPGNEETFLLNLGDDNAWQYCFDTVSSIIARLNVSVYRQDFNFHPLAFWRSHDTPERQGITEIKHINGLYKLWDALLDRFPYLLIDNCASGGRRIDVETLRRSVPLWRSDAQCPADPVPELAQAHSLSHSTWMPYSGTGMGRIWYDTYRFRSAYSPALTTNFTFSERNRFGDDPEKIEWLKKMCEEYLRVRPYLSKDIYPLTQPGAAKDIWCAAQYHDSDTDSGVLIAFRRENSPYTTSQFSLSGLDESKTYVFEEVNGDTVTEVGNVLKKDGLQVTINEKRSSKIYFYRSL